MSDTREYEHRLANASSKKEIIEILEDLRNDLSERDPAVIELIKKYTK